MITVKSIVYKPKSTSAGHDAEHGDGYLRQPLQEANLLEGYGIEGDRKGGNPNRNLNVMDEITQDELAAKAGLTRAALSRIESGQAEPRPSTVRRLAQALRVEPDALMPPLEDFGE